jgi:hypothetical protein
VYGTPPFAASGATLRSESRSIFRNKGVYTSQQEEFQKNLQGATTMNRGYLLPLCLATITLSSGCSMMAPRYTASIDNV